MPIVGEVPRAASIAARLARIGIVTLLTLLVVASLLTFPGAIPWMAAFWLLWHTAAVFRGRTGWGSLAVCLGVLAAKGVDWFPALVVLAVAVLVVLAAQLVAAYLKRPVKGRRSVVAGLCGMWLAWLAVALTWAPYGPRQLVLDRTRPVVCLGDSLTAFGYPNCLAELLSVPVIDLSQNGVTAEEAAAKLPEVAKARPQVVVIELGGHEYLRGADREATRKHLQRIIDECRSIGAAVVLMEIPRGFMIDPYFDLERQMARQQGLELISDTPFRWLVLMSPAAPPGMWMGRGWLLSDDGLHPNARGNRMLAECVAERLRRMYGKEVLKR